jgi:hypothetical protein
MRAASPHYFECGMAVIKPGRDEHAVAACVAPIIA